MGGTARYHCIGNIFAPLACNVVFDLLLIHLHIVPPGTDHRKVGALNRIHAVVRAAGYFELEFIGQGGSVHLVQEVVDQQTVNFVFIGAGHFTASRTDAGLGGPYTGAGAAEIESVLVDLIEKVLGIFCRGADEHDITGLSMKGDQA